MMVSARLVTDDFVNDHVMTSSMMYGHQFLSPVPDLDRAEFGVMAGAKNRVWVSRVAENCNLTSDPSRHHSFCAGSQMNTGMFRDVRR
jgi:hypothetical protein